MRIQAFDYSLDLLRAILWQYNDAARLQLLLEQKQEWYDVEYSSFWNDWVRDVFDLRTANNFGLAVWAIILGLPLSLTSGQEPSATIWGFGSHHYNFNRGNFAPSVSGIQLTMAEKRLILRLRYFQLTTRGAIPNINRFLKIVFAEYAGQVYVLDGLDMTITYVFTFLPPPNLLLALQNFDVLPRPAGVGINYVVSVRESFGFGPVHQNFERGTFGSN